jgi:hypothetical protein
LENTTGTFRYGSLAIPSVPVASFNSASLYFTGLLDPTQLFTVGHSFTLDSMEYDTAVPEPGTIALLACGLLGLCGRKFLRGRA